MGKKLIQNVDDAMALIESKLNKKCSIEIQSFKFSSSVKLSEIALVEKELKLELPVDYKNFITKRGLFEAMDNHGKSYFRMLNPSESVEVIRNEVEEFDEEAFGSEPEDIQRARREHQVRRNIYPLQYVSQYVSDFYSYYLNLQPSPILDIYHDDFALADWLLAPIPKFAEGAFTQSYDEHFIWIIAKCIAGKYSPLKAE